MISLLISSLSNRDQLSTGRLPYTSLQQIRLSRIRMTTTTGNQMQTTKRKRECRLSHHHPLPIAHCTLPITLLGDCPLLVSSGEETFDYTLFK
jgi:hypothetical protein